MASSAPPHAGLQNAGCQAKGLLDIISSMKSAFISGRLITDYVLVAYECVHKIKNKRKG
jgi:hypothetical protein